MVAHIRLDVCDGMHWAFVMKKALNLVTRTRQNPTQRKGRDEWGTRLLFLVTYALDEWALPAILRRLVR